MLPPPATRVLDINYLDLSILDNISKNIRIPAFDKADSIIKPAALTFLLTEASFPIRNTYPISFAHLTEFNPPASLPNMNSLSSSLTLDN